MLEFLEHIDFHMCLRLVETGCEVVDKKTLFEFISHTRAMLSARGHVYIALHSQKVDEETKCILKSCAVENNRREVELALFIA